MKVSASIELVMQLAVQEATSGRFKEIDPPHVLAAILKFAELPVDEVDRAAPGSDAVRQLGAEVRATRAELAGLGINSKQVRRRLRAELGRGDAPSGTLPQHRSRAAREAFDAAAQQAERAGDILKIEHLWEALLACPSPVVKKVFGDAIHVRTWQPGETPLLNQYGHDLTRLAAEGKLPNVAGREVECKALLETLARATRRAVLLVAENDAPVREVLTAVAHAIAGPNAPVGLKDHRLIDLTGLKTSCDAADYCDRLADILAEATRTTQVILWLPGIKSAANDEADKQWLHLLETTLVGSQVRCICCLTPQAHAAICRSFTWRRLAHVMWLHEEIDRTIPQEL